MPGTLLGAGKAARAGRTDVTALGDLAFRRVVWTVTRTRRRGCVLRRRIKIKPARKTRGEGGGWVDFRRDGRGRGGEALQESE